MLGTHPSKSTIKDTNAYVCEAQQQFQHPNAEVQDYMQPCMERQITNAQTEERMIEDQLQI